MLMQRRGDDAVAETETLDAAWLVDLGKREEGEIETAAVVEIEMVGLVDHGGVVKARAGLVCPRRGRRR